MAGKISKFKEKLKEHFIEILKTHKNTRSIALGFAIGSFITILPTPGFNILVGLLIVFLFPYVNKYALFTSYFVFNGFVKTPIYILALNLGYLLFGNGNPIIYDSLRETIINAGIIFILGVLILDIIISIASYHVVYRIVEAYRKHEKSLQNK
jgi:hypothetical protein